RGGAAAWTVALGVRTPPMSGSLRPTAPGPAGRWHTKGALHVLGSLGLIEPDLLRRRLDPFESPMCDHSAARIGYDWASSADWLNRRAHWRRQCSGIGTSASASARSSQPARAIQAPWSAQGRADRRISSHGRAYERYRHNAPPRARSYAGSREFGHLPLHGGITLAFRIANLNGITNTSRPGLRRIQRRLCALVVLMQT